MSRHRIVRSMDYNDEYDGYDDVYGHSVDDDNCISPTDASQWLYDRARGQQSISAFMANNKNIAEEDEEDDEKIEDYEKRRRDSENFQMPPLDDIEKAKLTSCIDEIRSVVGDTVSERQIVETSIKFHYDVPNTLDAILNASTSTQDNKNAVKLKEPVEKDLKSSMFKNLDNTNTELEFKVPVLNLNINSNKNSTKLNALIKSNLEGSSPIKASFSLPKIGIPSSLSNRSPSSSSKLNQLILNQLGREIIDSETASKPFNIPQLGDSISNQLNEKDLNLSPHELCLKKIMETKKEKKNKVLEIDNKMRKLSLKQEDNLMVDLTVALSDGNISVKKRKEIINCDNFSIPFIDCDLPFIKENNMELDISGERDISEDFMKSPSNFAKILCLKYRTKKRPYIKHSFHPKHYLERFKFDSLSPDATILKKLKNPIIS